MSYTKGPWAARLQYGKRGQNLGWIIEHDNGRIGWASLAYADTNEESGSDDPARKANALLIAAAPDMAEALRSVVKIWGYAPEELDGNAREALEQARAALAKAGL